VAESAAPRAVFLILPILTLIPNRAWTMNRSRALQIVKRLGLRQLSVTTKTLPYTWQFRYHFRRDRRTKSTPARPQAAASQK
jgi:hypothetical protein